MPEKLLQVDDMSASIGEFKILHRVSLAVERSEVTVVLGRNGAGKTTTLRSIMGLVSDVSGSMVYDGASIAGLRTDTIANRGISYVPENRGMFTALTVEENLLVASARRADWAEVLDLFPVLRDKMSSRAGQLSGGQQQMLSMARALLRRPELLILDEPTKGLAPLAVNEIVDALQMLTDRTTILLVEQNLSVAKRLGTRFAVIDDGITVANGSMADPEDLDKAEHFLTISGAAVMER
jgi:branched-chain amino acid transport system ATP-binding protein